MICLGSELRSGMIVKAVLSQNGRKLNARGPWRTMMWSVWTNDQGFTDHGRVDVLGLIPEDCSSFHAIARHRRYKVVFR